MDASDTRVKIPDIYFAFLENLSKKDKLSLIEKLNDSISIHETKSKSIDYFYGIWESDNSAEELIKEIHSARKFTRKYEEM